MATPRKQRKSRSRHEIAKAALAAAVEKLSGANVIDIEINLVQQVPDGQRLVRQPKPMNVATTRDGKVVRVFHADLAPE